MNKYIIKTSVFPDNADAVFERLQKLGTLQKVAFPFASFIPVDSNNNIIWQKGSKFEFRLKLFCLIPMGIHTIRVIEFSKDNIYTNENNSFIPVWNHRIYLKAINSSQTEYTDEVEINAGWKTIFVYMWAQLFYAHRQQKWKKLILNDRGQGNGK